MGFFEAVASLSADVNKPKPGFEDEQKEGVVDPSLDEMELYMDDSELLELSKDWRDLWAKKEPELRKKQEIAEKYWRGLNYNPLASDRSGADNVLFEALETLLPIASSKNPDPVVEASKDAQELADKVRKMLSFHADRLALKLMCKQLIRFWALYYFGVVKVGWSEKEDDITVNVIRPQRLIIDPEAPISPLGEYSGEFVGEYKRDKASALIARFPKKASVIKQKVSGKMGTRIQYIEWWTDDFVFWEMDGEILFKSKNPYWNEDQEEKTLGEFGEDVITNIPANNHFKHRHKPYTFLSVFNLGKQPWDETSLVEQNLSVQDLITKRIEQINKNADSTNNGWVLDKNQFTKDAASLAVQAAQSGGAILADNPASAVSRMGGSPLPSFVYESLIDYRNEMRNNFGIRGSSAQGTISESTVRGKIITKGQDESRAGLITEHLEQVMDSVFNWMTQMMVVQYTKTHTASILGAEKAMEEISLNANEFTHKLLVSVKPGSMIPKDPLTKRNEAIDLWGAGAIDPLTLFERLDDPNPRESAKKLIIWNMVKAGTLPPSALIPDMEELMARFAPPAQPASPQPSTEGMSMAEQAANSLNMGQAYEGGSI